MIPCDWKCIRLVQRQVGKCINPSLHPHFFVYPNTLPPDWLNWCNKFWINASHFWRHKFKALVFSSEVMALSLSKKKKRYNFFFIWICELFQPVKIYQWSKTLRFLYLSFFSWILVAKKKKYEKTPKQNRFFYVCGFCMTHLLRLLYVMFIYVILSCFAAYSIEFIANFFNSRKSASSPASAMNAM